MSGRHIVKMTKAMASQPRSPNALFDQMPLEYARPQIEKIVLNTRQVDFLNKERERLYNEAIQNKKIIFYE